MGRLGAVVGRPSGRSWSRSLPIRVPIYLDDFGRTGRLGATHTFRDSLFLLRGFRPSFQA